MVKSVSDDRMLELALVENLQREDLNAIEKAEAYRNYIERFGLTQAEASSRLGKDRSTIANTMRLLELPEEIRALVSRGTISAGHGRALLGLEDDGARLEVARQIAEQGLSVRAAENAVRRRATPARRRPAPAAPSAHMEDLEGRLRERLGTRVRIQESGGRGKVVIDFYSREDFDRILEILEP